jgi:thiol-disulfide isomerase/thioredoxin
MLPIIDYFKTNYKFIILIILAIIVFSIIAFFVLKYSSSSSNNNFKNISNNAGIKSSPTDIYIFYASWCPHCKTALPKWKLFSDSVNGKIINGSLITTHTIDCTNNDDENVKNIIEKFNVKGYPTVKGVQDNKIINFDAKITEESLNQFIQQLTI